MNCTAAESHLLDPATDLAPEMQAHLAACADCRAVREELLATQGLLRHTLDAPPVPDALRTAFYDQLDAAKHAAEPTPRTAWWQTVWQRIGWPQMRWTLAFASVFALGVLTATVMRPASTHDDLAAAALFDRFESVSSAERLEGVRAVATNETGASDRALVDALLVTLHTDPSINVRVAALDALTPFGERERVRIGVLRVLAADTEPLVQMAALRFVQANQSDDARRALDALLTQPELEPLVRSQAQTLTISL